MPASETASERNLRLFETEYPVVMITGSSAPRVGRRIAEYFAAQQFRLVLHAHHLSEESQALADPAATSGQPSMVLGGAIEDEGQVAGWVTQIRETYDRIDVLVNAAAIWDPIPLERCLKTDYEKFFQVNALGVALCCQHFGLAMAEQASGGAIVNIGDWAVSRPYRDFAAYFLSKGALCTCTQSMAVELATRNPRVRVNAILPGPVKMAEGITAERRAKIAQECLLQREGTADDVAAAAIFLATSPFITGVCLPVDGGRSIYAGPSTDSIAHPQVADQTQ
ncbi:MAG: SDR family oxidoreductase [Planctomycetales bacterium]|nr:SDR family oxidoreductase [Planctomycetales bacterium]